MTKKQQSVEEETLARTRRIETRLTQLMIGLGIGTKADKPVFDQTHSVIHVPSMHSSLQEILDSIPEGWQGPARVCIGSNEIAQIALGGTEPGRRGFQ